MPVNNVFMQFVSTTGTFTFDGESMPLFGRRLEYTRATDQGHGGRKINCTLQGFVEGKQHTDVIKAYQKLLDVIKCNDVKFTYKADQTTDIMVDQRVYMDDYSDPVDWKEYQGDYSIAFHYFEKPNFTATDLGIVVKYIPKADPLQTDPQHPSVYISNIPQTYEFDPPPLWAAEQKKNRAGSRAPAVTAFGRIIAEEATIVLTGRLFADNHHDIRQKIDLLRDAFKWDGSLIYGEWQNDVRVEDLQIPTTFPRNYCDYTIVLKYDTKDIIEFRSRRRISRLHKYPKITEIPACGVVRVQEFSTLGQTINYFIYIRCMTNALARSLLSQEVSNLIIPGGVELEGGSEEWDDSERSVTLSCSKYYVQPPIPNIQGS
jgi:hypothetical protein